MKRALVFVDSVRVECPSCGEPARSRNGSDAWALDEVRLAERVAMHVHCACGAEFSVSLPQRVATS